MDSVLSGSGKNVAVHALALAIASAALCGAGQQPTPTATPGSITGDRWVHVVRNGETWTTLGARMGVDREILARRNGLTVGVALKPGDALGIDNRHIAPANAEDEELIINLPQRMLFNYWEGAVRGSYPIAVGRPGWPTPIGPFSIIEMESDPTWDVPLSIQEEMRKAGKPVVKAVPPGPDNPLGKYWMRLSFGSVGVHGTTAPSSIYRFATHGCIRMHPEDVDDLFHRVALGSRGRIVYEPVLVAFDGVDVFVEVHADPYRRAPNPLWRAQQLIDQSGLRELADPREVARVVREAEGLAVQVTARRQTE
jgi:L,D-transpeptidase ErfK/SrfK